MSTATMPKKSKKKTEPETPKVSKQTTDKLHISVQLSPEEHKAVTTSAARNGRSWSAECRIQTLKGIGYITE